jgi:hypothetical protein
MASNVLCMYRHHNARLRRLPAPSLALWFGRLRTDPMCETNAHNPPGYASCIAASGGVRMKGHMTTDSVTFSR